MKKKNQDEGFTLDHDLSKIIEVPSVSLLLNRKKYTKKGETLIVTPLHRAESPTPSSQEITEVSLNRERTGSYKKPASPPPPPPKKVVPLSAPAPATLKFWSMNEANSNSSPFWVKETLKAFGKQSGVLGWLILEQSGDAFFPAHAIDSVLKSRESYWSGMRIKSRVAPKVWATLEKNGWAEVSYKNEEFLRIALGVRNNEYLYFVRLGAPGSSGRVLAVYTTESITENFWRDLKLPQLQDETDSNVALVAVA